MIEWALLAKINSAYGLGILVLVTLAVVVWLIGLVVRRLGQAKKEKT